MYTPHDEIEDAVLLLLLYEDALDYIATLPHPPQVKYATYKCLHATHNTHPNRKRRMSLYQYIRTLSHSHAHRKRRMKRLMMSADHIMLYDSLTVL